MTAIEQDFPTADIHPIDIVETLAEQAAWEFDRVGENQIAMAVEGGWRTYSLTLLWSEHDDMLRLVCTFDLTPPEEQEAEFLALLNLANDRVWGGSFTLWKSEGQVIYRAGLSLAGGASATPEQVEAMVCAAIAQSERFYPAFQLVAFGGESAERGASVALDAAYGTA